MFGFKLIFCQDRTRTNLMALHFIRRDHSTIVLIIVLLIFENVFYLEKSVLSCVIFHLKLLHLYDFQACKDRLKILYLISVYTCYMVCLTRCGMLEMWYARSGILSMWEVGDVWMLGMWDIGNRGCWEFVMLGVWDVKDVGYWGCGMFGMWDVRDVAFRDVGCLGCGMFRM